MAKVYGLTSDQQQRVGRVVQDFERRTPTPGKVASDTSSPSLGLFFCDLVQDDGGATTQGNKTTAAAFTYKIRRRGVDTDLATGKSPEWGRWPGKRTVASKGIACFEQNDVVLLVAFEILGTGGC